ncbi:MAG: cytochrome-c peroxidase [Schleiferiaceae bacterium]
MKKGLLLFLASSSLFAIWSFSRAPQIVEWEAPEVVFPKDNPLTDESIELGSALFFETLLSKDSSISCQSCHLITEAFADHLPLGEGIKGRTVFRNTPTLTNIGLHPYFMADGKFATLEDQVLGPIEEHREFDMTPEEVVKRLKTYPLYNELSQKGYGTELTFEVVQKSLANFERMLVSQPSKFDEYQKGLFNLTPEESRGWDLFQKPGINCIQCHNGYNFTNYAFENNGFLGTYLDSGRAKITGNPEDFQKFKVPTLRNIAITYPYMHDGSIKTLEEVIRHYENGGLDHPSQSPLISGFEITDQERKELLAFLETLTEYRYLENE